MVCPPSSERWCFYLQRQSIISTTTLGRQPLYVFTSPAIQHPNEACYISRRTSMGTSKHSNHSTTGSATRTRYHNHSSVTLDYQHDKKHAVCQQFLSKVFLRVACSMQLIHGERRSLHFWYAEGIHWIYWRAS